MVEQRHRDARPTATGAIDIVDTVFRERRDKPRRRTTAAALFVVAIYGGAAVLTLTTEAGMAAWSADLAARIHADLANERPVEMLPPPATQPAPARSPTPPLAPPPSVTQPAVARAANRQPRRATRVAPAQAAPVITRAAPEAPLDLTDDTFASGGAAVFSGGATAGAGRSTAPVAGAVELNAPAAARPTSANGSLAKPVTLAAGTWACPWPSEADAEQIDQQTVVLRVRVRSDGTVETAQVITDPGVGFGRSARECALRTRFQPAHRSDGIPVAAWSPPIRVHFSR